MNQTVIKHRDFILAAGLVMMTVLAYLPATQCGFIWDDDKYVTENPLLTAPDGLWHIWFSKDQPSQYFPMVYTTFRIEHSLWGLNPHGYHINNILLHAANAVLVWFLLKRLSIPCSWVAAAVFALHPVHVESVAWITERKNVLMLFFFLLSLLAWIRFIDPSKETKRNRLFYVLSLLLYLMALFSKTTACTLPVALVLILLVKHIPVNAKRLLQIAPYILLGLAMGILTVWWEQIHQGTSGLEIPLTVIDRILLASRALWFYAGKLIWPVNLAFSYATWTIDATDARQYAWPLLCLIAIAYIWHQRARFGRMGIAAVIFFVAMLFPMLGFFELYTFRYTYVADHYQYASSIGLIALIVAVGYYAAERFGTLGKGVAVSVVILILGTLGALTWQQTYSYKDRETLWRDTLKKNPESAIAHNNLGVVLQDEQGKVDEAIEHYTAAIQIKPDFTEAHNNLGRVMMQQGKLEEAAKHLNEALRIDSDFPVAYINLGGVLVRQGKLDEAIGHLTEALRVDPDSAEAHGNLGYILMRQGKLDKAVKHLNKTLRIRPDFAEAHSNLGYTLMRQGKLLDEAVKHFTEAMRIKPDWSDPVNNLAWLLATHKDKEFYNPKEAVRFAMRACELDDYKQPRSLDTLAAASAAAGRFSEAVASAEKAVDLALSLGQEQLKEEIKNRLLLYKNGQSYTENGGGTEP
jgi:protein O-mannosyl-transferase